MGARGPLVKSTALKPNQGKYDVHILPPEGFKGKSPTLPKRDWHPETAAWYKSWRTSPQAESFFPSDWQRLILLAPLVDLVYDPETDAKSLVAALSEIRTTEAALGGTVADRTRLRMSLGAVKPGPESVEQVATPSSAAAAQTFRVVDMSA